MILLDPTIPADLSLEKAQDRWAYTQVGRCTYLRIRSPPMAAMFSRSPCPVRSARHLARKKTIEAPGRRAPLTAAGAEASCQADPAQAAKAPTPHPAGGRRGPPAPGRRKAQQAEPEEPGTRTPPPAREAGKPTRAQGAPGTGRAATPGAAPGARGQALPAGARSTGAQTSEPTEGAGTPPAGAPQTGEPGHQPSPQAERRTRPQTERAPTPRRGAHNGRTQQQHRDCGLAHRERGGAAGGPQTREPGIKGIGDRQQKAATPCDRRQRHRPGARRSAAHARQRRGRARRAESKRQRPGVRAPIVSKASGFAAEGDWRAAANQSARQQHPEPQRAAAQRSGSGAVRPAAGAVKGARAAGGFPSPALLTASQSDFHGGGRVFPLSPRQKRSQTANFAPFCRLGLALLPVWWYAVYYLAGEEVSM